MGGRGEGLVRRDFTHNFCCYVNRSVCLYLLRATASFRAAHLGNFDTFHLGVWGTSNTDVFSKKKKWCVECVLQREEEFANMH